MNNNNATSVIDDEVEKFSRIAEEWWDENGKFKPLHRINPVRLEYITSAIAGHYGRDRNASKYLQGLRILDIGCGGGLLCEPLARLGASVTGIDASAKNISVAKLHSQKMALDIDYRNITVESIAESEASKFDVILNMEVLEHVDNPELFVKNSCKLLQNDGLAFLSTLSRTLKALALAKFGAEYIMRWLPVGTHDWNKFIKPSELAAWLRSADMQVQNQCGLSFNPIKNHWHLSDDIDINYMVTARRLV